MTLVAIHSIILRPAILVTLAMDDHFCRIRSISNGQAIGTPIFSNKPVLELPSDRWISQESQKVADVPATL